MSEASENQVTLFARTNFRNRQVPFGIKREDRRKHMYIVGKTGMGKTNMIENMIIQDIVNGEGVCFVDPNGDAIEKILDYIPAKRINDVVYVNPADMDFPIAFNILESVDPKYKHLVASGLMSVFTKIWANLWSARMEYILNNSILALLDSPGNTLLGISRLLVDKKYRKKIVDNIKDPMVKSFWVDEFANWNEKYRMEAIAPIQNKVGQFLSSGIIRNIVGQPKSTLDLRELMDNKKILLVNLSKGRVGEDNSALLGAMIITKLQLAAFSRADIPEDDRADFYLYVDEFQNFATESFATILSEARKYHLNLIIAHQYIGQLVQEKNTKVRDAVFGNVGTMITFRIGAADAEFLENEFMPLFTENDLVNIPKYTILLKLMINGVASDPFTAETLPPSTYVRTDSTEKVIRVSRERYANPVAEVEEKIMRWMGQDYHEQAAVIASHANFEHSNEEELELPEEAPAENKEQSVVPAFVENTIIENPVIIEESVPARSVPQALVQQPAVKTETMRMQAEAPMPERRHEQRRKDRPSQAPKPQQNKPQNKPQNSKKENPIWNQVADLHQGSKKTEDQFLKSFESLKFDEPILTKASEPASAKPEPIQTPIVQPQQLESFDEIPDNLVPMPVQQSTNDSNQRSVLQPGQSVKIDDN
ncbi:MAG: hypothetical protein JWO40_549 [Candidatus Doudnabacteria bacterium]|nr:hypothetical protein [Candidatus Doudnabacteria bacterium]